MLSAILHRLQCRGAGGQAGRRQPSQSTPLCTRAGQTGCVITYVSFRAEAPPPPARLFGRAAAPGTDRRLHQSRRARPAARRRSIPTGSRGLPPSAGRRADRLVVARARRRRPSCAPRAWSPADASHRGQAGYLAVTRQRRSRRRPHRPHPRRRLCSAGMLHAGWGLHLVDVNLAQGDLIRAVEAQRGAPIAPARGEDFKLEKSVVSSEKISSTGQPSARASLSASRVEGMNTPFSTVLMVLRLTPTSSASAAWVRPRSRAKLRAGGCARPSAIRDGRVSRAGRSEAAPRRSRGRHEVDRLAAADRLEHGEDVDADRLRPSSRRKPNRIRVAGDWPGSPRRSSSVPHRLRA